MKKVFAVLFLLAASFSGLSQTFTHADTLRGFQTPERVWWNVLKYDITVEFDATQKSVKGSNVITYVRDSSSIVLIPPVLQVDLMEPMTIDSAISNGVKLKFTRDGNAWFITQQSVKPDIQSITLYYHGIPPEAKRPPWDGGLIWSVDSNDEPWISIACEGFGASCWFPNKDQQADEADSVELHITVPNNLKAVGNGRMSKVPTVINDKTTYHWKVTNKINNYSIIPYIGNYESFSEKYIGKNGPLDITYWALQSDLETAKQYWPSRMKESLKSLERWFGPYPFYKDGFQLIQAPHLGMEHQSAIAYGNEFRHGYLGEDLSRTGWGLKWDFIILHESAHEWFGNSITAADAADMWIHEAFATYAEVLYIEEHWGRKAGVEYLVGRRDDIANDTPIIGTYNVNKEGSGDMYNKGANFVHVLRLLIDDDAKFKAALLEMNKKFYHRQVNTKDMLDFWNSYSSRDLTRVFDQYLKSSTPPILLYNTDKIGREYVSTYQWIDCVEGFDMPVKIDIGKKSTWIYPTTSGVKELRSKKKIGGINNEFYVLQAN